MAERMMILQVERIKLIDHKFSLKSYWKTYSSQMNVFKKEGSCEIQEIVINSQS